MKMHYCIQASVLVVLFLPFVDVTAFVVVQKSPSRSCCLSSPPPTSSPRSLTSTTRLQAVAPLVPPIFLLGRFRKKRKVDQTKTVEIGDVLPDVDVEQLVRSTTATSDDVNDETDDNSHAMDGGGGGKPISIRQALGNSTAVLVGMPGAFTPTCTKKHLPGYVAAAPKFAKLGIDKIAVLTTNDRFVNEEWSDQLGVFGNDDDTIITMLSDGDGDLIKSLGLAEDMGFGVGVRSKRFALVAKDGVVTNLFTDEGMDECTTTSAENLIRVLSPQDAAMRDGQTLFDGGMISAGVVAGLVLLFLLSSSFSTGGPADSGFSLLQEYK